MTTVKVYLFIILFIFTNLFNVSYGAEIYEAPTQIGLSKDGKNTIEEGIVDIYNSFISQTTKIVNKISEVSQKPFLNLLKYMAIGWLIFIILKALYTGSSIFSVVFFKLILLVFLTSLFNPATLRTYIIEPLKMIYDNLPIYISNTISDNNTDNAIQEIFHLYTQQFNNIYSSTEGIDVYSSFLTFVVSLLAMLGLGLVVIRVLFTTFINVFIFYLLLSFTSFWLLFTFFKTTRAYTLQAFNIVIACIIQMCFLLIMITMFNNISKNIFRKISDIDDKITTSKTEAKGTMAMGLMIETTIKGANTSDDYKSKSILLFSHIVFTFVQLALLKISNDIAGKISTVGSLATGGSPRLFEVLNFLTNTVGSLGKMGGKAILQAYKNFKG